MRSFSCAQAEHVVAHDVEQEAQDDANDATAATARHDVHVRHFAVPVVYERHPGTQERLQAVDAGVEVPDGEETERGVPASGSVASKTHGATAAHVMCCRGVAVGWRLRKVVAYMIPAEIVAHHGCPSL